MFYLGVHVIEIGPDELKPHTLLYHKTKLLYRPLCSTKPHIFHEDTWGYTLLRFILYL